MKFDKVKDKIDKLKEKYDKAEGVWKAVSKTVSDVDGVKKALKEKNLLELTGKLSDGAQSVNTLIVKLDDVLPDGIALPRVPDSVLKPLGKLNDVKGVYESAGNVLTALVADAAGGFSLESMASLTAHFNQNWDTFSAKIDSLFDVTPESGKQAVLETLAKSLFPDNVYNAFGTIKRQTPGILGGIVGLKEAIKTFSGSYKNPAEAINKISSGVDKIVSSVEKLAQSVNNIVKMYQGWGGAAGATGYPLLDKLGKLGDMKVIQSLQQTLRMGGGVMALQGNLKNLNAAIRNKDINGMMNALKGAYDNIKVIKQKGTKKSSAIQDDSGNGDSQDLSTSHPKQKAQTNADVPDKQDDSETQNVENVRIGVFFDGTNNNMVQRAYFESEGKNLASKTQSLVQKSAFVFFNKLGAIDAERMNTMTDSEEEVTSDKNNDKDSDSLPDKGFSNVSILHDCYDPETGKKERGEENWIYKHFYIEGSGATDVSHVLSKNFEGLGFGLGSTGVVTLVSKAVKYISNFILSEGHLSKNKEKVNIVFDVVGFSRGSACARLFSHLVTRGDEGNAIDRESEFNNSHTKPWFKNGKLEFLKGYKKTVAFLGIYDTVASIGVLEQKDGLPHPLISKFLSSVSNDYEENWHYLNAGSYGLKPSDDESKLRQVCHICAMDELRENFALTSVGNQGGIGGNAVEIFVPGCHSDVGGGYVDNNEETSVLPKTRLPNSDGIPAVPTYLFVENPQNMNCYVSRLRMGVEGLRVLGWVDKNVTTSKYTLSCKDDDEADGLLKPIVAKAKGLLKLKSVKFKKRTRSGYSNIPLDMMRVCANKRNPLLFKDLPLIYDITKNTRYSDLRALYGSMMGKLGSVGGGQREWLYPEGRYGGEEYRKLRLKYIHFTSTKVPNPVKIANPPNFDLSGNLCRIVYFCGEDNGIHYMQEFNQQAKAVSCNIVL